MGELRVCGDGFEEVRLWVKEPGKTELESRGKEISKVGNPATPNLRGIDKRSSEAGSGTEGTGTRANGQLKVAQSSKRRERYGISPPYEQIC